MKIKISIHSKYICSINIYNKSMPINMRGSRKFCQRASNSDNVFFFVFLVDEGSKDQNYTKTGHDRPASETPFKWRFAGVAMMAQH